MERYCYFESRLAVLHAKGAAIAQMETIANVQSKRICIICFPNYPSKETGRGIDKYSYELLNGLKKLGINPLLVENGVVNNPLQYIVEGSSDFFKVAGTKADLYHAVSELAAKNMILTGKPLSITTIHDLLALYFGSSILSKYSYQKICLKLASKSNKIIATSKTTKNLLTSILKVPSEKVSVIYYGVDHDLFKPTSRMEKENKTILYVGSLTKIKGIHLLIKAFKLVQKELKNVELVIGGKRKNYALFRDITCSSDVLEGIKFLGFIKDSDLPKYYSSCNVFVWPAYSGITLSVLDAMACGAPIVISNAFDAAEYVGDAGILVEPGNVKQLAEAMLSILVDENVERIYSQKSVKRAELFSWEIMVKETVNLYDYALKGATG